MEKSWCPGADVIHDTLHDKNTPPYYYHTELLIYEDTLTISRTTHVHEYTVKSPIPEHTYTQKRILLLRGFSS